MKMICKTNYDSKALAAMSLVMRKTLRRRFNRLVSVYLWGVIALLLLSIWLSLDEPLSIALYATVLILLLAAQLRQDAVNAFFARRHLLPGAQSCSTVFYPDCYEVTFPGAMTRWQYEKVLVLAETRGYIVFVLGKTHAQSFPKAGLEGASLEEFRAFLKEKTGKPLQKIGRWANP